MAYTKRQIIAEAFNEIGLGAYAYSLQPEDLQTAVRRLNTMLARWQSEGITTGFTSSTDIEAGSLDDDSGLLDEAHEPVILNLAIALAPAFGKVVSNDTKTAANRGKKLLRRNSVTLPSRAIDYTAAPLGAGHKRTDIITMSPEETDDDDDSIVSIVI